MTCEPRDARRHDVGVEDQRNSYQRDRDRVLYSSAFHRLAGITQIVRAGEGDGFHTRQQHSYKVAQVGRRLAEKCLSEAQDKDLNIPLEVEVVEAACLAHDLGHPPFGHAGEKVLCQLVEDEGDEDGFEGNAQSFRIITKLAVRFDDVHGLNFTRATLNACLKYPWLRDKNNDKKKVKWCVYKSEEADFLFARSNDSDEEQSQEAHLMDWADDISYSVHDLEEFHRCRVLPWAQILDDDETGESLIERAVSGWFGRPSDAKQLLETSFAELKNFFEIYRYFLLEPYDGRRDLRFQLRNMTSQLVGHLISQTSVEDNGNGRGNVHVSDTALHRVIMLKQITRDYIISNPSLAAQQRGQRRIIEDLFKVILGDLTTPDELPSYLPERLKYLADFSEITENWKARFVCDCIASLTEREVTELHARLHGLSYGSVLDPIVR